MQGDNWGVSRGCRLLALSKVVIHKGPEVVTAATEESLREASSESTRAGICPQKASPGLEQCGQEWDRYLVAEEAGISHSETDIGAAAKAIGTREGQFSKVTLV